MTNKNIFAEEDRDFNRRNHGCDGCKKGIPTERFDGYRGGHLWLCSKCYKILVEFGIKGAIQGERVMEEIIIKINRRKAYVEYPNKYEKYRGGLIEFLSHLVDRIDWKVKYKDKKA